MLGLADLHWADEPVLELADRLLSRLRNAPLLLLATARPGFDQRWSPESARHNAFVLHLDPLDRAAAAQLVHALFEGCADDETVDTLLERSGGNPFFVEELVAYVQDSERAGRGRRATAGCGISPRRCTASSRPGSTRSSRPNDHCSRTARSSAVPARSRPRSRSRVAKTRRA